MYLNLDMFKQATSPAQRDWLLSETLANGYYPSTRKPAFQDGDERKFFWAFWYGLPAGRQGVQSQNQRKLWPLGREDFTLTLLVIL